MTKTRHHVEGAVAILAQYQRLEKEGKLPQAEAKRLAADALRAMRWSGNGYVWINDMLPRMVMHPTKPELDGKDLSDYKDNRGNKLFAMVVDRVRSQKSGYVEYWWPIPQSKEDTHNTSFVQGFEPWHWVVGSGVYLDDVSSAFWQRATYDLAWLGVMFLVVGSVSWWIRRSVFLPTRRRARPCGSGRKSDRGRRPLSRHPCRHRGGRQPDARARTDAVTPSPDAGRNQR